MYFYLTHVMFTEIPVVSLHICTHTPLNATSFRRRPFLSAQKARRTHQGRGRWSSEAPGATDRSAAAPKNGATRRGAQLEDPSVWEDSSVFCRKWSPKYQKHGKRTTRTPHEVLCSPPQKIHQRPQKRKDEDEDAHHAHVHLGRDVAHGRPGIEFASMDHAACSTTAVSKTW